MLAFPRARLAGAMLVMCGAFAPGVSHALFSDDEARLAILEARKSIAELRQRVDASLAEEQRRASEENAQLRRSVLELSNQIEALRADMARMRGQEEQLARDVAEVQRRQKDLAQEAQGVKRTACPRSNRAQLRSNLHANVSARCVCACVGKETRRRRPGPGTAPRAARERAPNLRRRPHRAFFATGAAQRV